ncbi:MAG: type II toxin-antitoxin system MqsA family antitoxin [Clostridiales bacterium]|nr:type II toxin-antitoxin system MqsA family antitoxin [Clostridiales bacterium]
MNCIYCKNLMENEYSLFALDLGESVIVVRKVPSHVCDRCGQTVFDNDVSKQLDRIVDSLRSSADEVNIVEYADKVA